MDIFLKWITEKTTIVSILIVFLAIAIYVLLGKLEKRLRKTGKTVSQKSTISRTAFNVVKILLLFVFILVILQINGINISSLVAGLGIASAVVGLALQDYLKDVIMGWHILSDHFFSVGECVEYQGREGVILNFNLKATKIGDLDDHSVITVCNRNISEIRRLGKRMDLDIPLPYSEDPQRIHNILKSLCSEIETVDTVEKCEYKGTEKFDSSAVLYRVRIYCDPQMRPDVRRDALRILFDGLNAADIHIPFNQLDVHMHS